MTIAVKYPRALGVPQRNSHKLGSSSYVAACATADIPSNGEELIALATAEHSRRKTPEENVTVILRPSP